MTTVPSHAATQFLGALMALHRSTAGQCQVPSPPRPRLTADRPARRGTGRPAFIATLFLAFSVSFIILASVAYFLLGQHQKLGGTYFLVDDAWIHLRFAQNLAAGDGFSFNPGHPIAASTAPLWTTLLGLSHRVTGDVILSAYVWSIVFFAITCLLVARLVLWITDSVLLATASAIVAACCPWLTWSALSGMEILLSAACVLTTLFLHLKYQDSDTWQGLLGVAAAALTTLTRPETYVLFLAIVIHRVARSLLPPRQNLKRTLCVWLPMAGVVFAIIVLPYGVFSIATAGSFFPNTYAAKVGDLGVIGALKSGSAEAIKQALLTNPRLYLADLMQALQEISPLLVRVLPVAMLGLLWKDVCLLPLFLVLFPLVVGMVVPTRRISWPWYRHMLNLIPVYVVVSLAGSHQLLKAVLSRAGKWAALLRVGLLAIVILAMGLYFVSQQPEVRESFISRGATMKAEHISVANWINEHLPPQAVIASSDIGVVGFCTQRFIIDTEGLITPEILGQQRLNSPAKDQEVYAYLQQAQPDYLVKFHWVYPTLPKTEFTPVHSSGNLTVYRTPWTRY